MLIRNRPRLHSASQMTQIKMKIHCGTIQHFLQKFCSGYLRLLGRAFHLRIWKASHCIHVMSERKDVLKTKDSSWQRDAEHRRFPAHIVCFQLSFEEEGNQFLVVQSKAALRNMPQPFQNSSSPFCSTSFSASPTYGTVLSTWEHTPPP